MSYKESKSIVPSDKARSVWRIWSDGSVFSQQNMNTIVKDVVVGTGEGFIAGFDSGGLSLWASSTPDRYVHYNSGVYYVRSMDTDPKAGVYRIYVEDSGSFGLTEFPAGDTGWSFIYLDYLGRIGEYTGATWTYDQGKLLIGKVIRDGNNTIENSDIVDMRKIQPGINEFYKDKDGKFNINGDVEWSGSATGKLPDHDHSGDTGDGGLIKHKSFTMVFHTYLPAGFGDGKVVRFGEDLINNKWQYALGDGNYRMLRGQLVVSQLTKDGDSTHQIEASILITSSEIIKYTVNLNATYEWNSSITPSSGSVPSSTIDKNIAPIINIKYNDTDGSDSLINDCWVTFYVVIEAVSD